ncbi:hypothetical protein NM208_g1385 [Fusarium decemcellulare]|uniref:Uncharacterized protein n=1 Tax=Fusarium decemcellulare TaxID=57161 RepID=A0ACC1SWV1_9HYPO|nr:hypothetical protein NM208_g1385 [Fusarium decemcellulare]
MNREQMAAVARNLDELEVKVNQLLLITLDLRSENERLRTENADLRAKHQSQVVALCAEIKRLKKEACKKSDRVVRAGAVEKKRKNKSSKKRAPSYASRYSESECLGHDDLLSLTTGSDTYYEKAQKTKWRKASNSDTSDTDDASLVACLSKEGK